MKNLEPSNNAPSTGDSQDLCRDVIVYCKTCQAWIVPTVERCCPECSVVLSAKLDKRKSSKNPGKNPEVREHSWLQRILLLVVVCIVVAVIGTLSHLLFSPSVSGLIGVITGLVFLSIIIPSVIYPAFAALFKVFALAFQSPISWLQDRMRKRIAIGDTGAHLEPGQQIDEPWDWRCFREHDVRLEIQVPPYGLPTQEQLKRLADAMPHAENMLHQAIEYLLANEAKLIERKPTCAHAVALTVPIAPAVPLEFSICVTPTWDRSPAQSGDSTANYFTAHYHFSASPDGHLSDCRETHWFGD
jgi:hypothetical protein